MDARRFDALTRVWSTSSRRQFLGLVTGGLVGAVVSEAAQQRTAAAQSGDECGPDDPPCDDPDSPQLCCAGYLGYVCAEHFNCCQPGYVGCPNGGCCNPAQGEVCNPSAWGCVEGKLKVTALRLNDIDNTRLAYLSAANHTYFGGNTRIHGTITIKGAKKDKVTDVVLEVLQGGGVVATATLAPGARSKLLTTFGSDETIAITTSRHLFNLPAAEAANVDGSADSSLTLRVRVTSARDGEATRTFGDVQLLVRYDGTNRYGPRDGNVGGDDWVKPSVKEVLEHFTGNTWGDISNMNGGKFAPHKGHRNGQQADGHFAGYNARNAATAATIIDQLNDATYGSRIERVFVTYDEKPCDAFCRAIRNVELNDGRRAIDVIRPVAGHGTHFHWNVSTQ